MGWRMKDFFFSTRCLKPLNFKAKFAFWLLFTLVIEMQLPETWEVCYVKQEKGTMHYMGDLIPSSHLSDSLSRKCCSLTCQPLKGTCSSSFSPLPMETWPVQTEWRRLSCPYSWSTLPSVVAVVLLRGLSPEQQWSKSSWLSLLGTMWERLSTNIYTWE